MQTEPWNEKLWGLGKTYFFLRLKCKSSLSFSIAFVLSGTLDFKQTIIFFFPRSYDVETSAVVILVQRNECKHLSWERG